MRSIRIAVAAAAVFAVVLFALGGASYGSQSKTNAAVSFPTKGCGSFSEGLPKDPNGVLKTLDKAHRATFDGITVDTQGPALRSAWVHFKAKSKGNWKVVVLADAAIDAFQTESQALLTKYFEADKSVSSFQLLTTDTPVDVPEQVQQFQTVLASKPTVIILESVEPSAMAGLVTQAGKEGIPVVTYAGDVNSAYALNVNINTYLASAEATSIVARLIGGTGNVLFVHGIPGTDPDVASLAATNSVIANCPGLKLDGQVTGDFAPAPAQAATLQFLATHPEKISMVVQAAGMCAGIITAFQTSGRPVPPCVDMGTTAGTLSYWLANRPQYQTAGFASGGSDDAGGVFRVTTRLLEGQGPKVNYITPATPLVTSANLRNLATPGIALDDSTAVAWGPSFLSNSWLNDFFTKP